MHTPLHVKPMTGHKKSLIDRQQSQRYAVKHQPPKGVELTPDPSATLVTVELYEFTAEPTATRLQPSYFVHSETTIE